MKNKFYIAIWMLACSLILLPSCSDDADASGGGARPVISVTNLNEGGQGDLLIIKGSGFGNNPDAISVVFGETSATIVSATDTEIRALVPDGDRWDKVAVLIRVKVGGEASNAQPFTYLVKPVITEAPAMGVFGETIEIHGKRFSPIAAENTVMIGSVEATVLAASQEKLTVELPGYSSAFYNNPSVSLQVSKFGAYPSNELSFGFDLMKYDSLLVVNAEWSTQDLRSDIVWKSASFRAYGNLPRVINVLEITPDESTDIGFYMPASLTITSTQCKAVDAVAGINGGFFGASQDYVRIGGVVKAEGRAETETWGYVDCALVRDASGWSIMSFARNGKTNTSARALDASYTDVMVAGPRLLNASVIPSQQSTEMWTSPHPRTAFGIDVETGKIYMVTVDGRFSGLAIGLSTKDLSHLMRVLGCTDAINLDGGGSTTMYIKEEESQGYNGVVNYPCDNATFDHAGERTVGNIVYVK